MLAACRGNETFCTEIQNQKTKDEDLVSTKVSSVQMTWFLTLTLGIFNSKAVRHLVHCVGIQSAAFR